MVSVKHKKICLISLGCARNLVDSEMMLGLLAEAGYELISTPSKADFIIINTCGFLKVAREEAFETIEQAFKSSKKSAKVIIAGCMAQKFHAELSKRFPNTYAFVGPGGVDQIVKALGGGLFFPSQRSTLGCASTPRVISTPPHLSYLKIAEGCCKQCAYCLIPQIKGPLKSKPIQDVGEEFRNLLSMGVKEVLLVAQDLGDYGKDLGFQKNEGLKTLLRHFLQEKGDFWLRLLYLYPDEIDEELILLLQSDPRLCPYLDLPIQHISDRILTSMGRKTSKNAILKTLASLRQKMPEMALRTSLIVGFPGETEADFEELLQFVGAGYFDHIGAFLFSPEEGTAAALMENQVTPEIRQERCNRLIACQQKVVKKRYERMIGKKVRALVDGLHPESPLLVRAHHQGQCPEVDGQILINNASQVKAIGEWVTVEITTYAGYDLVGYVLK